MTALNRTPENTNFLQPSKFIVAFNRLPTVQYFCHNVNLPGVSIGSINYNTPLLDIPLAGNKLNFNEFTMQFYIDETITSWNELYNWFLAIAAPTKLTDRASYNALQTGNTLNSGYYSDATLTIMSALNNPIVSINFYRMFPIQLSDIQFDTQSSADNIISATATFRYERFVITPT